MNRVKQRLIDVGFTIEQANEWIRTPNKALSPTYEDDITPQQLIDEGKEDVVLALVSCFENGDFSL